MLPIFLICGSYYIWNIYDIKLYGRLSEEEKKLARYTAEKGKAMGEWIWSYMSQLNGNILLKPITDIKDIIIKIINCKKICIFIMAALKT